MAWLKQGTHYINPDCAGQIIKDVSTGQYKARRFFNDETSYGVFKYLNEAKAFCELKFLVYECHKGEQSYERYHRSFETYDEAINYCECANKTASAGTWYHC